MKGISFLLHSLANSAARPRGTCLSTVRQARCPFNFLQVIYHIWPLSGQFNNTTDDRQNIRTADFSFDASAGPQFTDEQKQTQREAATRVIPARDHPSLFYCNGPKCGRSVVALGIARKCGYTNLHWYRGGFEDWKSQGIPLPQAMNARMPN